MGALTFAAVTTFNNRGLHEYGERMVQTYLRYWPARAVPLRVYVEGWSGVGFSADVLDLDLYGSSPWLADFKRKNGARGRGRAIDYRWDAVKFAHKVAALTHAARTIDADILIWLDGDIVTHAPITRDDLAALAPTGDQWIAWLDRARLHPECGFFMLNTRHPRHAEMIAAYETLYTAGGLFRLAEWHDSFALQHVVRVIGRENRHTGGPAAIEAKSLSGEVGRRTNHPLVNGPLGQWFDHLKGARKSLGKTPREDLRVPRQEAYWR